MFCIISAMELVLVRVASLIAIAFVYMLFDIFNKRNIPSVFAYASLAYGVVLTLLYLNAASISISLLIAAVVLGAGYAVYRAGMLGAGDVLEFATLSLILPFQSLPVAANIPQLGLPFIVSLFIDSGIAALIAVPLYYIPLASKVLKRPISSLASRRDAIKAMLVGAVYLVFLGFLAINVGTGLVGVIIVCVIAFGSFTVVLFERPITMSMVRYLTFRDFEEGDIIAWNLMKQGQISRIRKRVPGFDRLVTKKLIAELKRKRVKEKVPVYKNAIPLAAPIFIGVVLSVLLGNVILLLLPHL